MKASPHSLSGIQGEVCAEIKEYNPDSKYLLLLRKRCISQEVNYGLLGKSRQEKDVLKFQAPAVLKSR